LEPGLFSRFGTLARLVLGSRPASHGGYRMQGISVKRSRNKPGQYQETTGSDQ
jgi:hypothetical protein